VGKATPDIRLHLLHLAVVYSRFLLVELSKHGKTPMVMRLSVVPCMEDR
jgi:hypothetical protein